MPSQSMLQFTSTILLLLFFVVQRIATESRDVEVAIDFPSDVRVGDDVTLRCDYEITDGWQRLLTLKWYKDGHEFYRFKPSDDPNKSWFKTSGIMVDLNNSQNGTVAIRNVTLYSNGLYRCEVSLDKPSFAKVIKRKIMKIHEG